MPYPPRLPHGFSPRASCRPSLAALAALAALQATATAALAAEAETASPTLEKCAAIGPAADRLACYDQLAGRAPTPPVPSAAPITAEPAAGAASAPAATSRLAPKDGAEAVAAVPAGSGSLLSKYWELEPSDKRGVFNLTGYRTNYALPLRVTTDMNRSPSSPTQAAVSLPNYRRIEAKFQLSLRTKALQDVGLPGADLWLAFTQQANWQVWNSADSKPFRNSDYEPEAIYVVPTAPSWRALPWGWQWRFTQLALAHQSNGQSDPLSRSWNRVYLGAGIERGDWSLTSRIAHRLKEDLADDNNPDLVSYRGRADFQLGWNSGLHSASLLYRTTLRNGKTGALQLEYSYPVFRDQPNGVRWMLQAFSGYGETLTDYNFRQSSLALGVSFMQF